MKKTFALGTVLSILTDKLLAPNGVAGVYEILNHMTGDNLFTHQLGRVRDECRPYLLQQFPTLADVDASSVTPHNWRIWLTDQVLRFGEYLDVDTLPEGAHYFIEPLSELAEKVHPSRIVIVKPGEPKK